MEATPRLYYSPNMPEAQILRKLVETKYLPAMQDLLKISNHDLPVIWDLDFILGPKTKELKDSYVLCEINVSSVSPFPLSALPQLVKAVIKRTV